MLKDINFSELTIDNIGAWPKEIKLILIAICCLLLVGLGYWFDTKNQLVLLNTKKINQQDLLQRIEIKVQLAINLPAYKKQLEEMRRSFKVMLQQLPGKTEVPGLLEDITKAGITSGLQFKLFKPLPEKQQDFYAELPIEISVIGNYHQLGQFVSKVSSLPRIVTLHDYTIGLMPVVTSGQQTNQASQAELPSGNEKLVMNITAKTYRYAEEQSKPTVAK